MIVAGASAHLEERAVDEIKSRAGGSPSAHEVLVGERRVELNDLDALGSAFVTQCPSEPSTQPCLASARRSLQDDVLLGGQSFHHGGEVSH